jgi:hypothetical protein
LLQGIAGCLAFLMLPCAHSWYKLSLTVLPAAAAALWILFFASTPARRMAAFGVQLLCRLAFVLLCYFAGWTHWSAGRTAFHVLLELCTVAGAAINV